MADAHLIQPYDKLDRPNTTMVQAGGRGIYLITGPDPAGAFALP